jgi:hypothetical protein
LSPALATIRVYVKSDINPCISRREAGGEERSGAIEKCRSVTAQPTVQNLQIFQYLLASRESGGMADALDLGSITGMSA